MSTQNFSGHKTFTATAVAIQAFVRVTVDANGLIAAAGSSDIGIGITQEAIAASCIGTVKLYSASGTFQCQTAGPVTRGAALYAAAAGQIDDTGTYTLRMVALEAATAQGDIIETTDINGTGTAAYPYASGDVGTLAALGTNQGTAAPVVKAVSFVTGADDTTCVVLPTVSAGLVYVIHNTVADKHLHIYPGASDNIIPLGANAVMTLAASSTAIFFGLGAVNWACIQGTAPV